MNEHKSSAEMPTKTLAPAIGRTAAKRRKQLQLLEERRRRTMTQLNKAREELAEALAEAEARDRRRMRNQQQKDLKRLKFILGGLVVASMQAAGLAKFSISSHDLGLLSEKDRLLFDQVWAVIGGSSESGRSPGDLIGSPENDPVQNDETS